MDGKKEEEDEESALWKKRECGRDTFLSERQGRVEGTYMAVQTNGIGFVTRAVTRKALPRTSG